MGVGRCIQSFDGEGWGDMKARDHVEDVAVDGRIILKRILKKRDGKAWTEFVQLNIGRSDGLL